MKNIIIFTKPSAREQAIEVNLLKQFEGVKLQPKKPIIITIGGDGTMLMAIKEYIDKDVSFIGISAGSLGFLQTISQTEVPLLVTALQNDTFSTIKAPLLAVSYSGEPKTVIGYAFNDITVGRQGPRAANFDLHVDDNAGTFIGDGVIFSTPLGSTAYSVAAGGPIIDSKAQDVFVVTPSNPHISQLYSSLQRPHVMQKNRVVRVSAKESILKDRPLQLDIDGMTAVEKIQQPIDIYLSDKTISLLELQEKDFHSRIDKKRLGKY